ncbi:hypothetical protein Taro_022486 [Colocasia esculenta]|uniref:Uncharacterized protein n=1 Tax=Colocasia esculenta TaxID=4460 RepID=A0A843V5G6_COLES|nr:hypothetical protein [Colocasia esculenta]
MERHKCPNGMNPFLGDGCNWLVEDVAHNLEYSSRLNMATQYTLKLVMEHPSWKETGWIPYECSNQLQKEKFEHNIYSRVSKFAERYSINVPDIMNMVLLSADNHMMLFLGYKLLHVYICQDSADDECPRSDTFISHPDLQKLLRKSIKEICYFLAKYTLSYSFTSFASTLGFRERYYKDTYGWFCSARISLTNIINLMRGFRPFLELYNFELPNDFIAKTFSLLDLVEFSIHFTLAWIQRDLEGLILFTLAISNALRHGESFLKASRGNLVKFLHQSSQSVDQMASYDRKVDIKEENEHKKLQVFGMPENEQWQLIGVSLWKLFFNFSEHEIHLLMLERPEEGMNLELIKTFPLGLANVFIASLAFISSSLTKCLRSFMMGNSDRRISVATLAWLEAYKQLGNSGSLEYLNQKTSTLQLTDHEDGTSLLKMLSEISINLKGILGSFISEETDIAFDRQQHTMCWNVVHESVMAEYASGDETDKVGMGNSAAANTEQILHSKDQAEGNGSFLEDRSSPPSTEVAYFHNPQEVYKRNGELLEAICFNSTDECQVSLASNRKGLLFFNLNVGVCKREAQFLWSDFDWPSGGWAGSESTPIPTFVSPGVGLGNKKGAHLGLGGATIGVGLLARPGRDLTGGGAFGIPGYAGIGASGLGWGEQEDFEDFNDPPATVENIRTRALSSHPSKPFLLVGSSNTHIYLWEFGKDRAAATYGVLPAANVPPPYALASVSAVQFDSCGQRFATAALDGTVCTWQLEVGGRSNVHPTDSSLCFNKHASYMAISYIAASGSILATAGCSTNNMNVVIWDTLAPPTTSQASISCHEGGARSLSVFDNDIGIGSISPMIVTGGKNGDIGLHDFRYIATGKSKRHRHSSELNLKAAGLDDANKFSENVNGMIWHIPRAHLGSVTKIVTIPNTSLILSGSKDGDVKLWDAKRCKLVFHWPKLHERHTFLQPSSRGFGGVVRVLNQVALFEGFTSFPTYQLILLITMANPIFHSLSRTWAKLWLLCYLAP